MQPNQWWFFTRTLLRIYNTTWWNWNWELFPTRKKQKKLTLAKLFIPLLLRKSLERRNNQHHDLLPNLRPSRWIILQNLRELVSFKDFIKKVKEPGKLLLSCALAGFILRIVRDRLHQRWKVKVEVTCFCGAKSRVECLRCRWWQDAQDTVVLRFQQEALAEVRNVVEEEYRIERRSAGGTWQCRQAADGGRYDIVCNGMAIIESSEGKKKIDWRMKCSSMLPSSSSLLSLPTWMPSPIFQFPSPSAKRADSTALWTCRILSI